MKRERKERQREIGKESRGERERAFEIDIYAPDRYGPLSFK
jgi:hypothetical protein